MCLWGRSREPWHLGQWGGEGDTSWLGVIPFNGQVAWIEREAGGKQPVCLQTSPIFFCICAVLHHHCWHQTSVSLTFQLRLGKSNSPRILQAFYSWLALLRHLISWPRNLVLCSVHHWCTQPPIEYRKQTTEMHETNIFGGKVYSWKQKCTEIYMIGAEWGKRKSKTRSQRIERSGSLEPMSFWVTMTVNCEGHENPWDDCEQRGTLNTFTMGVVMI